MSRKKKADSFDNKENFVGMPEEVKLPGNVLLEESEVEVGEDGSLSGSGTTKEGDEVNWKLSLRPAPTSPNVPGERNVVLPSGCEFHRKENGEVWISETARYEGEAIVITPDEWACIIATMSWRDVECLPKAKAFHTGKVQ